MLQHLFVLFGLLAVMVVSLSWSETGRVTAAHPLPTLLDSLLLMTALPATSA